MDNTMPGAKKGRNYINEILDFLLIFINLGIDFKLICSNLISGCE